MPYPVAAVRGKIFGSPLTYSGKVLSYSPIAYWKLNETSGTAAVCSVDSNQNGTYARDVSTMGTSTGIGDGNTAPTFDGSQDFVNIYTTTFRDAFSGAAGTAMIWAKVFNVGVWTDADNTRRFFELRVDGNNRVEHYKDGNNSIKWVYEAGNTTETLSKGSMTTTGWFHTAVTWTKAGERVKYYLDGASAGNDDVNLGTWAGTLSTTETCIGSNDTAPNFLWHGYLAHPVVF